MLSVSKKEEMYAKRNVQIEINAWKHVLMEQPLSTIVVTDLIPIIRKRETEIRLQNEWSEQVTG